jgi:hypothetical protein
MQSNGASSASSLQRVARDDPYAGLLDTIFIDDEMADSDDRPSDGGPQNVRNQQGIVEFMQCATMQAIC